MVRRAALMDVKATDVGKMRLKCKVDEGADSSRTILIANGAERTMAGTAFELVGRK
jgi:hypothetical protein